MKLTLSLGNQNYEVSPQAIDISIPLDFYGAQPNTYGVEMAGSKAYESGGWVGDVRRGGSCNFETVTLTPHCNGTHTECVGHITSSRISVHETLQESLIPATLISIRPESGDSATDDYSPQYNPEDQVITAALIRHALTDSNPSFHRAIIIRSLPNEPGKQSRDYMKAAPPFLSKDAMRYLRELGVRHLLVDMPSVDRLFDEGKLSGHHIFWGFEQGKEPEVDQLPDYTITEMIYAPDELADGAYLLEMQIAPFVADAAPSRPRVFKLNTVS